MIELHISNMKLYLLQSSNQHKAVLLKNPEDHQFLFDLGWHSLKEKWHTLKYTFYFSKRDKMKEGGLTPTIGISSGGFIFRSDLVNEIFPLKLEEIELLPILVEEENWLLFNCLKTTSSYDSSRSKFLRSEPENGQIYMIQHVVVTDPSVKDIGLFTLEDSNRAWIIATETFAERIKKLGTNGLDFREIGSLECS
jgi:hypothetical protein